jgi:hypothetical protein
VSASVFLLSCFLPTLWLFRCVAASPDGLVLCKCLASRWRVPGERRIYGQELAAGQEEYVPMRFLLIFHPSTRD